MSNIFIPGDDIESARDNMRQVLSLFDSEATSASQIAQALGGDKNITQAGHHFDSRWSDGRTQLKNEGKSIIDALTKVIDTFTDTDNQMGSQLTSGGGNSS
jgi:hypothetical protein